MENPPNITQNGVNILTPSGEVNASVISKAVFGLPIFDEPQAVLVVNFGKTQPGESGSWAFRSSDGQPLGMLVGRSSPPLNESYLITTSDIVKNIEDQTGLDVKVPIRNDLEPLNSIPPQDERRGRETERDEKNHMIRDIKAVEQVRSKFEKVIATPSHSSLKADTVTATHPASSHLDLHLNVTGITPYVIASLKKMIEEETENLVRNARKLVKEDRMCTPALT